MKTTQAKPFIKTLKALQVITPEELSDIIIQKIKLITHTKALVKFCKVCEKCTLPRLVTNIELQAGFDSKELMLLLIDAFKNDAYDGLSARIEPTQWTCACTIEEYEAYLNRLHGYEE